MVIPSSIKLSNQLILGCHITGVFDVNRSQMLQDDDFSIIENWVNSISKLNLQAVIFHNNFSESTVIKHQSKNLLFIRITHDERFNPNVFRYFVYNQFLNQYWDKIDSLFVTDVSDVLVLKNPFIQPLFIEKFDFIFCGDEPTNWNNEWMQLHGSHLRSRITDYLEIETEYKSHQLLNCGIIGGNISIIKSLIESIWQLHNTYNFDNKSSYTGDMGAFNYIVRKNYSQKLLHGTPVNSEFKAYIDNGTNWFQHK
ncbi:MAG: hypothetical protein K9I35_09770 [Flavobacterium sp.]|nr:hypothetical protein [Flavobacterium sp.]